MKNDRETTINELKKKMAEFRDARGWAHFHTPKNLSMSIAIEAAELMEHFQWRTPEEAKALMATPEARQEISDEIADVASYILSFCNLYDIDLSTAIAEKMERNAKKYPPEKIKDGILPL